MNQKEKEHNCICSNDSISYRENMSCLHAYIHRYLISISNTFGKFVGRLVAIKCKYAECESTVYLGGIWLKKKKYPTVILTYIRCVSTRIISICKHDVNTRLKLANPTSLPGNICLKFLIFSILFRRLNLQIRISHTIKILRFSITQAMWCK